VSAVEQLGLFAPKSALESVFRRHAPEIERTGWTMASAACALTVTRDLPSCRPTDASNFGQCGAMPQRAGVWTGSPVACHYCRLR
jgi:hypothetical protein